MPMATSRRGTHERGSSASTSLTTILFLTVFVVAFFPTLFANLVRLPFSASRRRATASATGATLTALTCAPTSCSTSTMASASVGWVQKIIALTARSRGSYLITTEVEAALPELAQYRVGLLHLFMQHTSAALSLNENWDDDVRADMSDALDRLAPEDRGKGGQNLYRHSAEGPDDMPAHIKSALIGASVTIPIQDGRLATGTWQGIWYLEFRASKHARKLVATMQGEKI